MKNVFRKISNVFISGVLAVAGILPFWSVPVLADTTFYSYGQFLSNAAGDTLYGINLSVSPINFVVCNHNASTAQYYNVAYYAYATSTVSEFSAQASCFSKLGISSLDDLKAIRYNGAPSSFTYSSPISWNYGSYTANSSQGTVYVYCVYVYINSNFSLLSCYAKAGSFMAIKNGGTTNSAYLDFIKCAINTQLGSALPTGFTVGSFGGGWVKDSTAIAPVYDMTGLGGTGDDSGAVDPDEGGNGGSAGSGSSSSSSQQQQQQQSIAEGAVAFTIADGAFQNTNTQSQTIEENAVNVTVNNNNSLTQENYQELNSLINNYNGSSDDQNDPFQQAIGNFQAFHGIALAFAGLASIVFGWLPWWVTALLGAMFSMVCVFIVLRLIHLFK